MRDACSIMEAEALSLLEAMKEASIMNPEHVTFETDAQMVVQAIYGNHSGTSDYSFLINRINNMLCLNFNFKVKFVKRQANSVAHTLAKAANSWASHYVFYSISPCIENQLINEMS
jgi:ribonuclease HI